MTAEILDGRALAKEIRADVAERASAFASAAGRPVGMATFLVGDDEASASYARTKKRAAERAGIAFEIVHRSAETRTEELLDALRARRDDEAVDGLMVEMPLPAGCDVAAVQAAVAPEKDVDGVHPASLGRLLSGHPSVVPATPRAVMALLDRAETPLEGANALVLGRSKTVGLPAALLLLARNATVTVAHSRTRALPALARRADVLVVAVGVPGLLKADMVKPGATVIDVGTNWVEDEAGGRLVGDVDFDAVAEVAGVLTPVPGGVGPVTTATVLRTAVELAEARHRG